MDKKRDKIIVAITGASGSVYAKMLLRKLRSLPSPPSEVAVVFTDTGKEIWEYETGNKYTPEGIEKEYPNSSFFAPFASGSSDFGTMIICPASMGMVGRIAGGVSDDLIGRAADVMLKERRRLIIVPREAPYNLIHLRNMEQLTLAGAVICPASPSFYSNPVTIDDLVMTIADRILSIAGYDAGAYRWMENDR